MCCYGNGRRSPVADALLGLGGRLYQPRCFLISHSFFFFPVCGFFLFFLFFSLFFFSSPLSPLEICLGDFALAGSPGCQPPGAVPSILPAGLEAGRFLARVAFCQCPSPACLEVVGALWFPGLETGTPELTEAPPHPAAGSASSSAPSQLLKSKRAFNKKPNPQTSLRAEQ